MYASSPPALADMALFAAVVAEGSFTKAARALDMPKSSLSRRIADLEAKLGVPLLARTTRTVTPTEPGARFYQHCARIAAEAAEARTAIAAAANQAAGLVRVTAPVAFGALYLGPIAAEVLHRHPEMRLEIVLSSRVVDLVQEGFDVAVRIGKLSTQGSLVARKVGRTRRFLCASPGYLQHRGTPATKEDLASHDLLILGDSTQPVTFTWLGPTGQATTPVRGRLTSNHPAVLLRAAQQGLGIVSLPAPVARPEIAAGRLVQVLADHEMERSDVHVVYPSSTHLPARVRAFLDILAPRLREQIALLSG
jgi:DNA-binding transcriptional LysR family regulator